MRVDVINAVSALSEFFTYNVTPDEIVRIISRTTPDNTRDAIILQSFCDKISSKL